jgi:lipopolysaccharide export system permease protein
MRILDKYAIKEIAVPTLAGMLLVVVMMLGNFLFYRITDLVRYASFHDAITLLLLQIPSSAWMILPSGALFGCALAVTRLVKDSELTMMRMAGISVRRVFLPMFLVGLILSGVHYWVQEKMAPWAETKSKAIFDRIYHTPGTPLIQPNVFFKWENYTFYVQNVDRKGKETMLRGVMVYEQEPGEKYPTLTTAESARKEGNIWVLRDGVVRKIGRDGFTEYEARFRKATLDLREAMPGIPEGQKTPEQMSASELGKQIRMFGSSSSQIAHDWRTNYYFKLSIPLSCLLIMLCAAPLCLKYGRNGGFTGVLISVLVLAVYWNIIVFGKMLGTGVKPILPPIVAGWSEVVIFLLAGAIIMKKAE